MEEGIANKRWSMQQKQKIRDSRIVGTKHLVEGVSKYGHSVTVFVSASAIGHYNHSQSKPLTEESEAA
tara:strand:- start:1224 stop:1427 length:204 start_codon:yes stop_codon:yes gene_type:complete